MLLIAPDNSRIPLAFKLGFKISNNEVEYEPCIAGIEAALELGAKRLGVIGTRTLLHLKRKEIGKLKKKR